MMASDPGAPPAAHSVKPDTTSLPSDRAFDDLTFEQAFTRLESVLSRIEAPTTPLEEAIGLYEEGVKLAARCQAALADVELRLKKLDAQGRETDLKL